MPASRLVCARRRRHRWWYDASLCALLQQQPADDEIAPEPNLAARAMRRRGIEIRCAWEFIMFYLSLNRQFILEIGVGCVRHIHTQSHTHAAQSDVLYVRQAFLLAFRTQWAMFLVDVHMMNANCMGKHMMQWFVSSPAIKKIQIKFNFSLLVCMGRLEDSVNGQRGGLCIVPPFQHIRTRSASQNDNLDTSSDAAERRRRPHCSLYNTQHRTHTHTHTHLTVHWRWMDCKCLCSSFSHADTVYCYYYYYHRYS